MKKKQDTSSRNAPARSTLAACSAILDDWQSITMHKNPHSSTASTPPDYEVHIHGGVLIIGHGRTLAVAVRDARAGYAEWLRSSPNERTEP